MKVVIAIIVALCVFQPFQYGYSKDEPSSTDYLASAKKLHHADPPKAFALYEKAIALNDTDLDALEGAVKTAAVMNRFVEARLYASMYKSALGKRGLEGVERLPRYLAAEGEILLERGRYDAALVYLHGALNYRKNSRETDPLLEGEILSGMGTAWWGKGDYYRAMASYDKALERTMVGAGESSPEYALALSGAGTACWLRRDVKGAALHYAKARDVFTMAGAATGDGYADLMQNIGVLYSYVKRDGDAMEYYGKSKKIREDLGLTATADYASLMNNMGLIYHVKQENGKALESFEKSKEIRDRLGFAETPGYAILLNNIGLAHWRLGEREKALDRFLGAKSLSERLGLADTLDYANLLHNIGYVYMSGGDTARGEECLKKAAEIRARVGGRK